MGSQGLIAVSLLPPNSGKQQVRPLRRRVGGVLRVSETVGIISAVWKFAEMKWGREGLRPPGDTNFLQLWR